MSKPPESTSKTDILGTVIEVVSTRCKDLPCTVYIFSNLLDTRFKLALRSKDQHVDFNSVGIHIVEELLTERPYVAQLPKIHVWGFGFNDLDGDKKRELTPTQRSSLLGFWSGIFSRLSDKEVRISRDLSL